jgi:hypothetical protein
MDTIEITPAVTAAPDREAHPMRFLDHASAEVTVKPGRPWFTVSLSDKHGFFDSELQRSKAAAEEAAEQIRAQIVARVPMLP